MMDSIKLYKEVDVWLRKICLIDYPDKEIAAYYLGLFESNDGVVTAYLVGSMVFDEEDPGWASNEDFIPPNTLKTLRLKGSEGVNCPEVQTTVVSIMKKFLQDPVNENCFLNRAKAVAVGFEDGDLDIVFRNES